MVVSVVGGSETGGTGTDALSTNRQSVSQCLYSTSLMIGWASNKWPEPTIRELYDPEQVELTLFIGGTTTKTTTTTTKTTTKEQILELIEANPSATMSEIAEKIGLTKDGVYYHIKQMLGKKLIHKGPTNGGHWEIIK